MAIALLTTSLMSVLCLITTGVMGLMGRGHFMFGFFTAFLVTLAQSMTMFYFIGTGKQIKDLVAERPIANGNEFIRRTKVFKAKVFPPALWAMLFTMATMILGGGVDTHTWWVPAWLHGLLAAISLYYNIVATWLDARYIIEDNQLREEVGRLLQTTPASE